MKIFLSKSEIVGESAVISGEDAHHIVKVLRMKRGDKLTLCDNEGIDHEAVIDEINSDVKVQILRSYPCLAEPNVDITIFQCIPKSGKFEYIVQKCTEIGITRIVPVISHRCVGKIDDSKKIARFQKVAVEAAKQCGRGRIPEVCEAVSFKEAIKKLSVMEHKAMPYENELNTHFRDVLKEKMKSFGLLIGPEGGFEDKEAEIAKDNGIPLVTLGKRILRTETVAIALTPIILYHLGGF